MSEFQTTLKLDHPDVSRIIFHPSKEAKGSTPEGCVDFDISVEENVTIGARFHLAEKDAPNVLLFHGNGEIVSDYDDIGQSFVEHGMSLLAVDYRGYGWSGGVPCVSKMMQDAHSIVSFVTNWLAEEGRKGYFIVMGRSLGSASALELAVTEKESVAGIIIDSGFGKTLPLLRNLGVDVDGLEIEEEECFNNLEKVATFKKPMLILHAQFDQIIPVDDAAEIHSECTARSSELQIVPGADHNTIFATAGKLYFEVVQRFVKKIGMPPRRPKKGVRPS